MSSNRDVAERYFEVLTGKTSKGHIGGKRNTVFASGDTLYSYGTHFPMVEPLRDKNGAIVCWLLNGDRWSNTTSGHQSMVRGFVRQQEAPSLIVPFTPLQSAGVRRATIEPVNVREDGHRVIRNTCDEAHILTAHDVALYDPEHDSPEDPVSDWYADKSLSVVYRNAGVRCPGGRTHVTTQHFLGASVFTATVVSKHGNQQVERHNVRFISAFDEQEARALYFLAELPATSYAQTYEEALEDLRPRLVKAADQAGREVVRQGDMFAIEPSSEVTRKSLKGLGYTFTKRASLHGTAHTATEVANPPNPGEGLVYARGTFRHEPSVIGESWREKDHAMRRISDGKKWFIIEPNTVPRGLGQSDFGPSNRMEPRAWTQGGQVD